MKKTRHNKLQLFIGLMIMGLFAVPIAAQSTAFTYQGKLANSGNPATGNYDLQFKLFDALTGGNQIGATVDNPNTLITNGIFTVELDFAEGAFDGTPRYLEICVRPTDSKDPYTVLAPRQSFTSIPYAMHSANAAAADGLSPACAGCVTDAHIETVDGAKLTGNVAGSQISGEIPPASVPIGSNNYIQNSSLALKAGKTGLQDLASFNIDGNGIIGSDLVVSGAAAIGINIPTNGQLHVLSSGPGTPAIYGESATSRGVWGKSVSSRGVYGESSSNEGVHGISNSGSGVYGESAAVNSLTLSGVFGRATGSGGTGVSALSTGSGGVGIYGEATTGRGVWGKSTSSRGVYGESSSSEGVYGISNTASGVHGIANNASGVGGYFQNNAGGTALLVDGSGKILFSGTGFVGIGTTSPTAKLHVEGGGDIGVRGTSTDFHGVSGSNTGVYNPFINPAGVRGFSTNNFGVFGDSTNNFGVYGVSANSIGVFGQTSNANSYAGYFQGNVHVTGTVTQDSDARLKQNISILGYGLAEVLRLRPVSWRWKAYPERGGQLGLVAQEVEPVLPELVSTAKDAEQTKGLNYIGFVPVLVNAIQEQQQQLEQYRTQLAQQQTRDRQQQTQLAQQQAEIEALQQELRQVKQQKEVIRQQQQEMASIRQLLCASRPRAAICKVTALK